MFDKSRKYEKFKEKVWLASPTMHGEELQYMQEAFDTNWMSTIGVNINEVETQIAEKVGMDCMAGVKWEKVHLQEKECFVLI